MSRGSGEPVGSGGCFEGGGGDCQATLRLSVADLWGGRPCSRQLTMWTSWHGFTGWAHGHVGLAATSSASWVVVTERVRGSRSRGVPAGLTLLPGCVSQDLHLGGGRATGLVFGDTAIPFRCVWGCRLAAATSLTVCSLQHPANNTLVQNNRRGL